MKLSYLAENLGFSIVGDKNFDIKNIAYADEADENDLAVAFSDKDISTTKAKVILTEPRIIFSDKIIVYCAYDEIISALAKIANFFVREGLRKNYDLSHKNNFIVGEGTIIESFVTIGDDVEIGKNCLIESNVTIGGGTVIKNNCVIHSGARIGAKSFLHYDEDGMAKCFFGIGRAILNDGVQVGYNSIIQRGTLSDTIIGERTLIGNLAIVAHDVKIGSHVKILAQSGVADNVVIEDCVTLLAKSAATKNIKRGKIISGMHGREHKNELKIQALLRKLKE